MHQPMVHELRRIKTKCQNNSTYSCDRPITQEEVLAATAKMKMGNAVDDAIYISEYNLQTIRTNLQHNLSNHL